MRQKKNRGIETDESERIENRVTNSKMLDSRRDKWNQRVRDRGRGLEPRTETTREGVGGEERETGSNGEERERMANKSRTSMQSRVHSSVAKCSAQTHNTSNT